MKYRVIHGVDLTTELLNEMLADGWVVKDAEKEMGVYCVIFRKGSDKDIENVTQVDDTLTIDGDTLGVNIDKVAEEVAEEVAKDVGKDLVGKTTELVDDKIEVKPDEVNPGNVEITRTDNGVVANLNWTTY